MSGKTILKVTANGQISIPAHVRRRWNTDRVIAVDTPWGLVVRPYDPNAVDRIAGSIVVDRRSMKCADKSEKMTLGAKRSAIAELVGRVPNDRP